MIYVVLGVDPGPTPGIVRLILSSNRLSMSADVVQCTAGALTSVLNGLSDCPGGFVALAYESFVNGSRAGRSSTPAAGKATRDMVRDLAAWAQHHDIPSHTYRASDVKPWATDARLERAGLLEATKGMRHARDASRHALFTAVKHYGLPDPLSGRTR